LLFSLALGVARFPFLKEKFTTTEGFLSLHRGMGKDERERGERGKQKNGGERRGIALSSSVLKPPLEHEPQSPSADKAEARSKRGWQ
jgi:hypothetical protein